MKKKIIIAVIIIVLIILAIFIGDLIRKIIIINNYTAQLEYDDKITTYYKKISTLDSEYAEILRKGDKKIHKKISNIGTTIIYSSKDENWTITNIKYEDGIEYKTAVKSSNNDMLKPEPSYVLGTTETSDLIRTAFMSDITSIKYNDIECYKIKFLEDFQIYMDKKTNRVVRRIIDLRDSTYEYSFDVTDEQVKFPDITGYTVKEER